MKCIGISEHVFILFSYRLVQREICNLLNLEGTNWSFKLTFCHPLRQCHTTLRSPYSLLLRERNTVYKEKSSSKGDKDIDPEFRGATEERNPYCPHQEHVNNLIRDIGLTKSNGELLSSKLKQWNLLDENVHITGQRKHHQHFRSFSSRQDELIRERNLQNNRQSGRTSYFCFNCLLCVILE